MLRLYQLQLDMELFVGIIIFILGVCIGSFINMAVFRTAQRYGITNYKLPARNASHNDAGRRITNKERSYCDFCGKQLKWYENIPVVSWVIQGGRSRCCGNPLPREYPVIEITTGLLFLLNYELSITNYELIINLLITSLLIFSLIFDLKYMILPDGANYLLIVLALIWLMGRSNWAVYLWSAAGSGVFFGLLHQIKIRKSEAMGMGDVKYAVFMGLFLGFPGVAVAGYLAFVVGAIIIGVLLLLKKVKRTDAVPFGPFLILATGAAWIWGEKIVNMINLFK